MSEVEGRRLESGATRSQKTMVTAERPRSPLQPSELLTGLMVRFASGDRSAFTPLFAVMWPIVAQYCRRQLRHPVDAEDAAQETVVKVFSRIADFDRSRDGLAWTLAIASYEVRTVRKRQQRRREDGSEAIERAVSALPGADDIIDQQELQASLVRAIEELSPGDRAIVDEILADKSGVRLAADARTRKRKQRMLQKLRALWHRGDEPVSSAPAPDEVLTQPALSSDAPMPSGRTRR